MPKIDLQNIASLNNKQSTLNILNNNSAEIETKSDTFLSRVGTSPNQMQADIDMNSQRIINLPEPATGDEPVRLQDLSTIIGGGTITNGAPSNASYVTVSSNADLASERVLTAGPGINIVDGGANGALTLSLNPTIFNVRDYGAVGNGTADDTAAIQDTVDAALSAIDDAAGNNYWGKVFFPQGHYKTTASIIFPQSAHDRSLILEGSGSSSLVFGSFNDFIFKSTFEQSNAGICVIRDLSISNGNQVLGSGCLQIVNALTVSYHNLNLSGFCAIDTCGTLEGANFAASIDCCNLAGNNVAHIANSCGVRMRGGGTISNCIIRGFNHGVRGNSFTVSQCDIENNMVGIAAGADAKQSALSDAFGLGAPGLGGGVRLHNCGMEANAIGILMQGGFISCEGVVCFSDNFCSPLAELLGEVIFTGTATNGSAIITGISPATNTAGQELYKGQLIHHTPSGGSEDTYLIQSVDSTTQITLTSNWNSNVGGGAQAGKDIQAARLSSHGFKFTSFSNASVFISCKFSGPFTGAAFHVEKKGGDVFINTFADSAGGSNIAWNFVERGDYKFIPSNPGGLGAAIPELICTRTVSELPPGGLTDGKAPMEGEEYNVTDANSTTFNAIVAGGGSNHMKVRWDGTDWKVC